MFAPLLTLKIPGNLLQGICKEPGLQVVNAVKPTD